VMRSIHGSRASSRTYGNAPPRELLDSAGTAVSCSDARLTPPPRPTTDDLVRIMAADTYVRTGAGGGCAVVVVVVGFVLAISSVHMQLLRDHHACNAWNQTKRVAGSFCKLVRARAAPTYIYVALDFIVVRLKSRHACHTSAYVYLLCRTLASAYARACLETVVDHRERTDVHTCVEIDTVYTTRCTNSYKRQVRAHVRSTC
jgi:hypothetical protein